MNVDAVFDVAGRDGVLTLPVVALRTDRDGARPRRLLGPPGAGAPAVGARARRGQAGQARAAARSGSAAALGGRARTAATLPPPVETGITDLDRVEITGGLAEGDEVLLLPTASLSRSSSRYRTP